MSCFASAVGPGAGSDAFRSGPTRRGGHHRRHSSGKRGAPLTHSRTPPVENELLASRTAGPRRKPAGFCQNANRLCVGRHLHLRFHEHPSPSNVSKLATGHGLGPILSHGVKERGCELGRGDRSSYVTVKSPAKITFSAQKETKKVACFGASQSSCSARRKLVVGQRP